ncbi:MAG: DJ-1/PfpI family protein [Capsulimonadales bacterium]|nr:DJ-1/PfpI family protein [Capsulimonadales bacterium]
MNRREFTKIVGAGTVASAVATLVESDAGAQDSGAKPTVRPATANHDMSGYNIPNGPPQQIAMFVYPNMTALDLVAPHLMFTGLMNVAVHLVAKTLKPIRSDNGLTIVPTTTLAKCPKKLTVLFCPGGSQGTLAMMKDVEVLNFLADRGKTASYVTSVCTGSLLLGAAGLLEGYRATSHWAVRDEILPLYGAIPVNERVVEDRNRITGAGVTAGMDFGLRLATLLRNEKYARALQLAFEYDPQPGYRAGTPETAGEDVVGMMNAMYAPLVTDLKAVAAKRPRRGTTRG